MTFIKHHRHHFGAFAILIIIAVVSGYFAFRTNITQNTRLPEPEAQADGGQAINRTQTTAVGEKIQDTTSTTLNTNDTTQNAINKTPDSVLQATPGKQNTTSSSNKQFINPVTVRVDDKNYWAEFTSSTTVYDLMTKLKSENKITFSGKEYSGMGFFVNEINGVKNDNLFGKYWIYYINGESAQVGISNYIIKQDDLIEWKYETTNL